LCCHSCSNHLTMMTASLISSGHDGPCMPTLRLARILRGGGYNSDNGRRRVRRRWSKTLMTHHSRWHYQTKWHLQGQRVDRTCLMPSSVLMAPRKRKTISTEAEEKGQWQRCPGQPKEGDTKLILKKMNRQSACMLRGVEEGINSGSGACTGSKVSQQGSGGAWLWATRQWRQAAFGEQRVGGGGSICKRRSEGRQGVMVLLLIVRQGG
jgi:hypothetical protein